MRKIHLALLCLFISVFNTVFARTLPEILRDGVANEPSIIEAQANTRIAESTLARTEASKYPVVQGTLTQPAIQTNSSKHDFTPGIRANWTVYDFGKRNAEVKRDELNVKFYNFKTNETIEELAYQLAGDYLEALKAKTSLDVAYENLARHQKIVNQLTIILEYDPGRRSEYTQAKAREIQVQESITSYRRALNLVLQRLNRYVDPPVQVEELADPFSNLAVNDLITRYHITETMAKSHPSYLAQLEEVNRSQAELEAIKLTRYPNLELQAEANKDDAAVYIVFGGDIFNATTQPGIDEQTYKTQAAAARLNQVYDNLKERADIAAIQMQEDLARIDIANAQIKSLEQVALDYEDQFKIATRSLLDVVNAYSELSNVKQLRATASYDLMKGKLDYLSSLGALSDWANIRINNRENFIRTNQPAHMAAGHNIDNMDTLTLTSITQSNDEPLKIIKDNQKSFIHVNRNGELVIETQNGSPIVPSVISNNEATETLTLTSYSSNPEDAAITSLAAPLSETSSEANVQSGLFSHYVAPNYKEK